MSNKFQYLKKVLDDEIMRNKILAHSNCNQELTEVLLGWESNQNIPGYLDYVATFSEELQILQESIEQDQNIQSTIEQYDPIVYDDESEQDTDAPWSTPKVLHYRAEILALKSKKATRYYSSDECEDFLYELFAAEHKIIGKGEASLETPEQWYQSCLEVIDIILTYHQNALLYTIAGEYKLYALENYNDLYKMNIDFQKTIKEVEFYYASALQYKPIEIDTHYFAIHLFYVKKDYKRAIEYIHANISLSVSDYILLDSPELCSWYGYLGEFYYKTGQSAQAKKCFEAMLDLSDQYITYLYTKEDRKLEMQRFLRTNIYRYLSIAPAFGAEILEKHYHKNYKEEYVLNIADLYNEAALYDKAILYYEAINYIKDAARCYDKIGDIQQAYAAYYLHIENLENTLYDGTHKENGNTNDHEKQTREDILDTCEKIYQLCHKEYEKSGGDENLQEYWLNEVVSISEKVLQDVGFDRDWEHRLVNAYYEGDIINRYLEDDIYLDSHGRTRLAEKYISSDDLKSALKACIYALKSMNHDKKTLHITDENISSSAKLSEVLDECIQKAENKKLDDVAQQGRDIKNALGGQEK